MTIEELTALVDIMGREEPVTSASLARKVIQLHGDLEARREQQKHVLKSKTRRNLEAKVGRLERDLSAKEHALAFAIKRNEVLRQKLTAKEGA